MELSDFAIIKLVPFVTGDNNLSRQRKGPELVELFCSCGYRDIYDFNNGGLLWFRMSVKEMKVTTSMWKA